MLDAAAAPAKRPRISLSSAIAGGRGYVSLTPSLSAADVRRVEAIADQLGVTCSAAVRAALDALARHLEAGHPRPHDVPPTCGPRLSAAEIRAGADGWAQPTYFMPAAAARQLDHLARRIGRQYSATIRSAAIVLERQLAAAARAP